MPELPEVETSRRGIEPWLVGQTIAQAIVRNSRLRWPVSDEIHHLQGRQIKAVHRRAKYLLVELDAGWIIIHLGMSGRLRVTDAAVPAEKHDHIDLLLGNGRVLRYTDPRRFGAWLWSDDPWSMPLLSRLGPEPLSEAFNAEWMMKQARHKKMAVKPWLMDNRLVVGVGNIYACESLFRARLSPQRSASSLTGQEIRTLVQAVKDVLEQAIVQGGTTLRDFLQTDGKPGYFRQELQVYGRKGEVCYICQTPVTFIQQAQRRTWFCPNCQR